MNRRSFLEKVLLITAIANIFKRESWYEKQIRLEEERWLIQSAELQAKLNRAKLDLITCNYDHKYPITEYEQNKKKN